MAEAHAATADWHVTTNAHRRTLDPLRPELQVVFGSDGTTIFIPSVRHMLRGAVRRAFRFYNGLSDLLWPLGPALTALIVAAFSVMVVNGPEDSWFRAGPVAVLLWRLDAAVVGDTPGAGPPRAVRIAYLACFAAMAVLLALMLVQRLFLRVLLRYTGYLSERTPSTLTKLWALALRAVFLAGRRPMLFSFQGALPRFAVPPLADTLARFLASVRPLLPAAEFASLAAAAKGFAGGPGPALQRYLWLKALVYPNYVSDWWQQFVYLRGRSSLFSSNYYGLGASEYLPTHVQHARAAVLVHEMLRFRQSIEHEKLAPMLVRNVVPLCMDQYRRLFGTTRVPGLQDDTLQQHPGGKHVAVLYRGAWYRVDVFDPATNRLLSPAALQRQFARVLALHAALAPPAEAEAHLAALTAADRAVWAAARARHFDAGLNAASLACIESAVCCVALDAASPTSWSDAGKLSLAGDGATRWLDKSLTLVVFANGRAAVHAEHTWGDAPVTAHMWEVVLWEEHLAAAATYDPQTGLVRDAAAAAAAAESLTPVERLVWDLSSTQLQETIATAYTAAVAFVADVDLVVVRHDAFGKGYVKTCKVAPDAFIQLALQLAYYRDQGHFDLTYESAMTRFYKLGRTETIRSLSDESCAFVRSMHDAAATMPQRIAFFKAAAERHKVTSNLATAGLGVDRHLFALYVVAKGKGYDASFLERALALPWRLTTSQLPQKQTTLQQYPEITDARRLSPSGGFTAGAKDGYGVSYMVAGEDAFYFHVSSYRACATTDSQRMAARILQACADIRAVFEGTYVAAALDAAPAHAAIAEVATPKEVAPAAAKPKKSRK